MGAGEGEREETDAKLERMMIIIRNKQTQLKNETDSNGSDINDYGILMIDRETRNWRHVKMNISFIFCCCCCLFFF